MKRNENPFDTFIEHMTLTGHSSVAGHWRDAAIVANDTLHIARLICQQQFKTDTPDPIDVLSVFKEMLAIERRLARDEADDVRRMGTSDADPF